MKIRLKRKRKTTRKPLRFRVKQVEVSYTQLIANLERLGWYWVHWLNTDRAPRDEWRKVAKLWGFIVRKYRKTDNPKGLANARRLHAVFRLRTKGILDLRGVGLGVYHGEIPLNPETMEPFTKRNYKKETETMATKKKKTTAKKKATARKPAAKVKTAPAVPKKKASAKKKKAGVKVKVKVKAVAKKKTAKVKRSPSQVKGKPRPVGKHNGWTIHETWIRMFAANAKMKKNDRWTDAQITALMKREFPGRESDIFDRIQAVRNKYNKGGLTQGVVPAVQSVPYDDEGTPIKVRRGPKGARGMLKKTASVPRNKKPLLPGAPKKSKKTKPAVPKKKASAKKKKAGVKVKVKVKAVAKKKAKRKKR